MWDDYTTFHANLYHFTRFNDSTFGTKRQLVIPWISPRYYYAKNLCSNIFIVFLFNSSSAEQIDLLENVFALSKGANYKTTKHLSQPQTILILHVQFTIPLDTSKKTYPKLSGVISLTKTDFNKSAVAVISYHVMNFWKYVFTSNFLWSDNFWSNWKGHFWLYYYFQHHPKGNSYSK